MADKLDKPAKKRQLKKVETVRQRAERAGTEKPRTRRVRSTASKASHPFKLLGKKIAKVLRPFAFVLKPFKTRPARLVGRILAAILLIKFFRNSWAEVRQVQWPDARTTVRLSIAVFIFSIVFGAIIAVTDYGLDKVFRKVFID